MLLKLVKREGHPHYGGNGGELSPTEFNLQPTDYKSVGAYRKFTGDNACNPSMKEREGAHHYTDQPKRDQLQSRYRVDHYGKSRNFAAYEGQTIIAVTLYRKGAAEITARLEEKDRTIAALESQLVAMSESQVFPALPSAEPVPAPTWTPPRQLALIAAEDMPTYRITSPRRRPARPKRRP